MSPNRLSIQFYVKGTLFAMRSWHSAPRVSDAVMLGPGTHKTAYRVKRVVWGVEAPQEESPYHQAVNIELVRIRPRPVLE